MLIYQHMILRLWNTHTFVHLFLSRLLTLPGVRLWWTLLDSWKPCTADDETRQADKIIKALTSGRGSRLERHLIMFLPPLKCFLPSLDGFETSPSYFPAGVFRRWVFVMVCYWWVTGVFGKVAAYVLPRQMAAGLSWRCHLMTHQTPWGVGSCECHSSGFPSSPTKLNFIKFLVETNHYWSLD